VPVGWGAVWGPEPVWTRSHHCPCRELSPGRPARDPVGVLIELSRLTHKCVICPETWNYRRLPQAFVSKMTSDVYFIAVLLLIGFSWPHNTSLC
jgi:hypothetical protein